MRKHRNIWSPGCRALVVLPWLVLGTLFIGTTGLARASCEPIQLPDQEARADVIVDATVLNIDSASFRSEVTLRVDGVFKGDQAVGNEFVLAGSTVPRVAGEVPFYEGWPYWRLYLREIDPGGGRYYTTLCDGSVELPAPQ